MRRSIWRIVLVAVACMVSACANLPSENASGTVSGANNSANSSDPSELIPRLSAAIATGQVPPGWEVWNIPTKRKTDYRSVSVDGKRAIQASSSSSASGLAAKVNIDLLKTPILQWSWRVNNLIEGADNTDRYNEDSPVRIVLAFEGDKSALPLKDQLFIERAQLLGRREFPYATLMYIWENKLPVGSVITSSHTGRIKKIVVASGSDGLNKWNRFKRDVVADYKLAYGKAPGKLIGVALLSDTDNTGKQSLAFYGDLSIGPITAD